MRRMNTFLSQRIIAPALVLGLALLAPAAFATGTSPLEVAVADYTMPWAPLIEQLFARAGASVKFQSYPPERSRQMLLSGMVDAEFFRQAGAVDSIKDQVALIGPLVCVEIAAYVRADSAVAINAPEDLKRYRVGAVRGNRIAEELAHAARTDVELASTSEHLMRMLDARRFDVALQTRRLALDALSDLQWREHIVQRGPLLANPPSYLVLRRQREIWAPRLEHAAKAMLASGEWRRLFNEVNLANGVPGDIGLSCIQDH